MRVLVVGAGSIGERHIRCFQLTQRVEVWACEKDLDLLRNIQSKYKVARADSGLQTFLADPPDIAVICTPAHLHVPIAIQLARQGVHLLIEKPLSTSLERLDELSDVISQNKLIVGVAYVLRHHPALCDMRRALNSGRFGEVRQLTFTSGQRFPFYRPAYRQIYYASRSTGGGAIQDALTHGMNAAEWLIGPMTRAVADADHLVLEDVNVEDTVHVAARHGQVMAMYSLNQYQAPNESSLTVVCENGTLRCLLHASRWQWQTEPAGTWQEGGHFLCERDDLFEAQASVYLDSVQQRCDPQCSFGEGLQTLHANLAVLQSVESGQWQSIGRNEP